MVGLRSVADVAGCGRIIVEQVEVVEALRVMGLSIEDLHGAIDAGEVDRNACTANNPPTDGGGRAHGTTVRVLRETLIPRKWGACNDRNFATAVAPDLSFEIAVASGDDATGDPVLTPKTKNKKGELLRIGIERNRRQPSFFPELEVATKQMKRRKAERTLLLLRYRAVGSDVIRCELSLPFKMGEDGKVEEWKTRIILPDLDLSSRSRAPKPQDSDGERTVIDIPVRRRTA